VLWLGAKGEGEKKGEEGKQVKEEDIFERVDKGKLGFYHRMWASP